MSTHPDPQPKRRFPWKTTLIVTLIGSLLGTGAIVASKAHESGWCPRGGHWRMGHHHGPMDPAAVKVRAQAVTDWILTEVDASASQREQTRNVIAELTDALTALVEQHRRHRDQLLDELVRPELDRTVLEQLRVAELALADTASQRLLESVTQIAEVLTPEQRRELLAMADRFHH